MENVTRNSLAWSGQSWRMPLWLWLSLAAMGVSVLHILLDLGVGLFPMQGRLSGPVTATVVLISLVQVWWCVSLMAGAQGRGGGVASAAVLGLGWTLLTNGSAIMYCMVPCPTAAAWALWRARVRVGWVLPAAALLLVVATIVALANAA